MEYIIFYDYFHSKENVLKVILLFTCSYLIKDNPPISERRQELRVYTAGEINVPRGIVLC